MPGGWRTVARSSQTTPRWWSGPRRRRRAWRGSVWMPRARRMARRPGSRRTSAWKRLTPRPSRTPNRRRRSRCSGQLLLALGLTGAGARLLSRRASGGGRPNRAGRAVRAGGAFRCAVDAHGLAGQEDHGQAGRQRPGGHRPAGDHGLRRPGSHLHGGRQDAVPPAGADRQRFLAETRQSSPSAALLNAKRPHTWMNLGRPPQPLG